MQNYNLNFLIEDENIQFDQKISPLLAACFVGKIEIINLLMNNEELDFNKESEPEGYYEIVRILLEKNADINKSNKLGQLPILFCFSRLEEESFKYENKKICMMMIDLFISKGADINVKIDPNSGYTILMKLASNEIMENDKNDNILEIIQFLIERGADVNLRGNDNKSIFEVIENSNNYDSLLRILRTSSQSVFFNTMKEDEEIDKEKMIAENNVKLPGCNFLGQEKTVIYENNSNTKMNCCLLF